MRYTGRKIWIQQQLARVDWDLLLFLLLFLDVKLVVKLAGLCFIYLRRFNLKFRFSLQQPGIPWFYPAMVLIALVDLLLYGLYREHGYVLMLGIGIGFWVLSILAFHQLALAVQKDTPQKIHDTLFLFFVLNAAVSVITLLLIMLEVHDLNPYRYQGNYQKYFISTGDYIHGITFDTSTTNAVLNAFGAVYFLYRRQFLMSIVCIIVLLLTCSNFTNLLAGGALLFLFAYKSDRAQKSIIVVQLAIMVMFLSNMSPQNNKYALNLAGKLFGRKETIKQKPAREIPIQLQPDSSLTAAQRKYKFAKLYLDSMALIRQRGGQTASMASVIEIPRVNIHAPEYQHRPDSSAARLQAIAYMRKMDQTAAPVFIKPDSTTILIRPSGKVLAFQQLAAFMRTRPSHDITGNGMGNFSSKLAFRATGLQMAGGYPAAYTYIHPDFRDNHLSVYLDYFVKDSGYHSIANSPNSVYGQMLGEYGIVGLVVFLITYVVYFFRGRGRLTYGLPILLIMLGAFVADYWFEQLSVVVLFELMLLLDRKETAAHE